MKEFIGSIKKYACFSGRASRREYWMTYLLYCIFYIAATVVDKAIGMQLFKALYALGLLLPMLGVFVRRLHDTGRSGWWWLIGLIPIVGTIVLLVFMCFDSQPGDNQYGPNPKGL